MFLLYTFWRPNPNVPFGDTPLRLTAEGKLRSCLFSETEIDIKEHLRAGASTEELVDIFKLATHAKPQRHALSYNQGRK
ncbi:MAG: hypothetical protein IME97_05670, partial [Proteobacteria bacterium]|nr:hypothetical protein [Pseudomonadota bacterium]